TNDTFPTATHVAVLLQLPRLLAALDELEKAFADKGREFATVIKSARTHLQDAVPITLGQEFAAYAEAIRKAKLEVKRRGELLKEVALGGTAAGTGANTVPGYRRKAIEVLARVSGTGVVPASDPRMGLQSHFPLASFSGSLRDLAVELSRISSDLRL